MPITAKTEALEVFNPHAKNHSKIKVLEFCNSHAKDHSKTKVLEVRSSQSRSTAIYRFQRYVYVCQLNFAHVEGGHSGNRSCMLDFAVKGEGMLELLPNAVVSWYRPRIPLHAKDQGCRGPSRSFCGFHCCLPSLMGRLRASASHSQ